MYQVATAETRAVRFPWILGADCDLGYLFLPWALAVVTYLVCPQIIEQTVVLPWIYAVNVFHQGATWFHYLDKQNRGYFSSTNQKKIVFYVVPPIILVVSLILGGVCPIIATVVYLVWSIQHLVQQNVGILLLYHNHGKNEAIVGRPLEVRTQHASAFFFALLAIGRLLFNTGTVPLQFKIVYGAALLVVAAYGAQYLIELAAQVRRGSYLNVPALAFWVCSMLFLLPFVYVGPTPSQMIMIPSILHWIQYIGLNYMLVKRKYSCEEMRADLPNRRPMLTYFAFCTLLVVLQFGVLTTGSNIFTGWVQHLFLSLIVGFGCIHYWLDAHIWRFREQFPRKTMLPYLVRH